MKNELRCAAVFLGLALLSQIAVADDESSAQKQNNQPQIDQDPRIAYAIKKLGREPEAFSDGIIMFTGLKSSIFSKVPIQEVYQYFLNECKKEGDGHSFTKELGDRWSKFYQPQSQDRSRLADYLISRGISGDKANDVAEAILFSGGGLVGFSKKKLDDAFQQHGKFSELGYAVIAEPFLCVAQQNGYERNIVFSAGFVGEGGGHANSFVYVPPSYFEAANKSSFDYHASDEFLSSVGRRAKKYNAEIAQQVLRYEYSGTGVVQSVRLKPDTLFGQISVTFSNHTKKPIKFHLQSIATAKFGDSEYGIVYKSINGRSLSMSSGKNCPLINGDQEALINPGADCEVSISPIEIPGIRPTKLPNNLVEMVVLGVPVKLSPVLKGRN